MAASSSSSSSSSTAAVQQLWLNDDQLARYFELEDEEDEEGDDSEPERKSLAASTPPPPPSASNVRSLSASKPATRSAPEQTLTSSSSSSLKRRWQATDEHDVDAKVRRVASASHSTPPVTRNLHSSSQLEIQTMQGAIDQKMQCAIEAHHQLQARKNTLSVGPLRDLASLSVAERFENRVLGDKRFNDMGMCQLAGILPSAGDLALKQKALPQLLVVPSATTEKSRVWRLGSRLNTVDMVAVVKGSKTLVRSEQYLDLLAIKLSDLDMRLSATTGLPVNVPAAAIYETGGQRASRMTCSRSTVDNQLILHDDLLVFHKAGIRWFCAQAKDGVAFAIGRRTPMTTNNAHPSEFKPHLLPMDENGARYEQLLWIVANTKTYAAQLAFLEEHMSDPKTAGGEWAYGDYTRGASQILRGLYSAAPHERQANELGMRLVQSSLRPSRTSIRAEGIRVMSELSNKMDHQTRAEIDEPIVATAASSFASECRGVTGQASIELAMCRDRQAAMEWMVSKTATNSTDALSVEASNFAHASYATFQAVVDVHKAFLCSTAAASSVLGFKKHGDLELAKKRDRQIAMAIEWHSEDHPTSCKFSILVSAKVRPHRRAGQILVGLSPSLPSLIFLRTSFRRGWMGCASEPFKSCSNSVRRRPLQRHLPKSSSQPSEASAVRRPPPNRMR